MVDAATVSSDEMEATFRPDRGMLGTSLRHRGEELLGPEGLPFLAPWANRLGDRRYAVDGVVVDLERLDLPTDPNGLPIHGTLMHRPEWEVVRHEPARLTATFDFAAHDDLLASFPFPHRLTIDVTVDGATLGLATTLEATGDRRVPVSFGYHPYLRLHRTARLRLPARRHLQLDARYLPTGDVDDEPAEDEPLGDRTFDDHYEVGDHGAALGFTGEGRSVTLTLDEGYPYAQVFAPEGSDFVCLEPMTAPVNALVDGTCFLVPPGDALTARFSLHVGRLPGL